jgi:uncharacterized damage-inducible protein DinB
MATRPAPAIAQLLALLDEAFEKASWHGPNLRGALRRLSAEEAAWRPAAGRHSIHELCAHAAYWKYAVRRRLTGEKRGSFAARGSNWFERSAPDAALWRADLRRLAEEHRLLRAAVAALSERDLGQVPPGARQTTERLVRGIAAHDLYHAGQVQLLKRLQRG